MHLRALKAPDAHDGARLGHQNDNGCVLRGIRGSCFLFLLHPKVKKRGSKGKSGHLQGAHE